MSLRRVLVAVALIAAAATACAAPAASNDATDSPTNPAHGAGGVAVSGRVFFAPSCPNEPATPVSGSPCSRRPAVGAVVAVVRGRSTTATTTTDAHGRFRVRVPPGHYTVTAAPRGSTPGASSGAQSAAAITAATAGTTPAHVVLTIDSGIR